MSRRAQARAVLLAGLLVVSSLSVAGVGGAAPSGEATTFHVSQGEECYEVSPISGEENVSEFYDYRTPNESYTYSSHGTQDIQQNQASNLFLYHGTEGVSLVMVHDKLGDGPHGSAITFDISGLPSDRTWAVEDDSYGENTDDNFTHSETSSSIDWMWRPDRTDGGAVRGLGGDDYEEITIDPGFNEAADDWGKWKWTGGDNRTEEWRLLGGDQSEVASLDLSQSVTIKKGSCPDTTDPEASLTATPNPVANDQAVTLDASGSSGTGSDVAEYRWDFENDSEIDRTTSEPTVSRTYDTPGTYTAAVTVVDGGDNTATTTTEIEVTASDGGDETGLVAAFSADPNPAGNDEAITFDAGDSSGDVTSYEWDFGDGSSATGETATHSYDGYGEYEVSLTVTDGEGDTATASETVTVEERDPIEYLNESAVRINGDFETVYVHAPFYATDGAGADDLDLGPVSGTTVLEAPDSGQWGPVIREVSVYDGDRTGDAVATRQNPDYESQLAAVRPERPSTFVESATRVGDGTYEVTFGYENPNDAEMSPAVNEFGAGNVDAEPPSVFEPGRNTFTVTWTPETDDSNLVWQTDFGNFDLGAATATSPTAAQIEADAEPPSAHIDAPETATVGETISLDGSGSTDDAGVVGYHWQFGDGTTAMGETVTRTYDEPGEYEVSLTVNDAAGNTDTATHLLTVEKADSAPPKDDDPKDDDGPTAKLTLLTDTADFGEKVGFDASDSKSDADIEEYRWNFDGDDEIDRRTNTKDNSTVYHRVHKIYDGPGTYTASVTVVDANGDKDIAGAQITIERNDHTKPGATLHVPETAEVGQKVHLKATDLTGVESGVSHICWVVVDGDEHNHDKPEGETATHVFDSPGDKTVKLHIVDKAGNKNMIERTITVEEADGGSDSGDANDGDDGDKEPVVDDPDDGATGGGIGTASPNRGSSSNDDSNERNDRTIASLGDDAGEVVVESSGASLTVNETAPADVRAPTAAADGFEALSYVTVADADGANATFTVSNDRLAAADAAPEHVSLFRYENDSWTPVDVERLNETDDAQRFGANATDGTYAVGVERPATAIAGLSVPGDRVAPGDRATVTATVANDGLAEGTHEVELTVDGEVVATESVTVPADSTREVEFARQFDDPGVYQVSVDDERAEIVVEGIETAEATTEAGPATSESTETTTESTTDGGVPGFGVGAALVAVLAAALIARRRS
ncbi:PKD domain-containing protein [Halorussus marinus]|uniref:PKD domain-containing protein n=1 Tax=Halorussus marinus TaxID=2505976 RepID=UPI00106E7951|nr:PKD domain-containing protein [Halorussus marinus]